MVRLEQRVWPLIQLEMEQLPQPSPEQMERLQEQLQRPSFQVSPPQVELPPQAELIMKRAAATADQWRDNPPQFPQPESPEQEEPMPTAEQQLLAMLPPRPIPPT